MNHSKNTFDNAAGSGDEGSGGGGGGGARGVEHQVGGAGGKGGDGYVRVRFELKKGTTLPPGCSWCD
jgi:hypothetical protein